MQFVRYVMLQRILLPPSSGYMNVQCSSIQTTGSRYHWDVSTALSDSTASHLRKHNLHSHCWQTSNFTKNTVL